MHGERRPEPREGETGDAVATREELADTLAGFALFADLGSPQLLGVAGLFEEVVFAEGERVLRQGLTGSGFYLILEGSADVRIDGTVRGTLHRGDFFGDVSILLGEPPTADIVATMPLSCLVMGAAAVRPFLLAHPTVMFRMLQALARRLRNANRWRN
jgi:CRP/FNR family transcriptional regulator, cyclic AMP receptor protein